MFPSLSTKINALLGLRLFPPEELVQYFFASASDSRKLICYRTLFSRNAAGPRFVFVVIAVFLCNPTGY